MEHEHAAPEFANEIVQFKVRFVPGSRAEYEIEANSALAKLAYDQAARSVGKQVTLPGFRKGKAPLELVIKKHSHHIEEDWKEELAKLAYVECSKLAKIPPLNGKPNIAFDVASCSMDGAKLKVSFETEPRVPDINPKEVVLKEIEKAAVNEEMVDEMIEQARHFLAGWEDITDRGVEEGDYVLLDVDALSPPQSVFKGTRFEVSDKRMAKWMKDLVLGHKVGAVLEGFSVPDEGASSEVPAKTAVLVTIVKVERSILPPIDENLAKKLGRSSVEELKAWSRSTLMAQIESDVKEKLREQVGEILLTKYAFEVPNSLVQKEATYRYEQLFKDAEFKENWEKMTEGARKTTVQSIIDQSKKAVQMYYLCRKIIGNAGIKITPQELEGALRSPLEQMIGVRGSVPKEGSTEHAAAISRILLEKAEDYVIEHATMEPLQNEPALAQ